MESHTQRRTKMPPSKNELAATLSKGEASRLGVLDAPAVVEHITTNSKRMYGFTRKMVPEGLPTEPKLYIFSISEYGDQVNLGPGFKQYEIHACPSDKEYGEPCVIDPINFFEEAKVDVTEHTFTSGQQIADAIMKVGPGMNASWDRRKIGWLVSKTNPPSEEDIKRAVSIYTTECQRLFQEGERNATSGRPNAMWDVNETHRRAAAYLGQTVDWDKPSRKMVVCDGCGDRIPAGAPVHAGVCGAVQGVKRDEKGHVTDTGAWAKALSLGMKTKAQVPEDIADLL
jgi:hypothetical protein